MHKATHWSWPGQRRTERISGTCSAVSNCPTPHATSTGSTAFQRKLSQGKAAALPGSSHETQLVSTLRQSCTLKLQRSRKGRSQPLNKSWRERHSMGAVLSLQAELPGTKWVGTAVPTAGQPLGCIWHLQCCYILLETLNCNSCCNTPVCCNHCSPKTDILI